MLFKAKFEQLFTVTKKQIIKQINNHIYSSFNYLYKETSFSSNNLETYRNTISFPKFTKESKTLDSGITEKELLIASQSMENNKSPGNNGLTRKFYITFWNEVKGTFYWQ